MTAIPEGLAGHRVDQRAPDEIAINYTPRDGAVTRLLAAITAAGYEIADLSTKESDLEDIFLQLTQGAHQSEG